MAYRTDGAVAGAFSPETARAVARGLGWFSIALGAGELLSGGGMSRSLGMGDHGRLVRAYGFREIATGVGILAQDDPTPWVWGRVGGDLLDLATLGPGLHQDNPERSRVALAMGMVAVVTALDLLCVQALQAQEHRRFPIRDYSDRIGLPRPPDEMRGAVRTLH